MIWKAHTKKSGAVFPPSILPLESTPQASIADARGRQPLVDGERQAVAALIGFQQPDIPDLAAPRTANETAGLIADTFSQIDLAAPAAQIPLLLPLSDDALSMDFVELLPRQRVIVELQIPEYPRSSFKTELEGLQARGFRIALKCADVKAHLGLYQHASYAIIELGSQRAAKIDASLEALSRLPLKTIARGITSSWQYQAALMRGFHWFQGEFVGSVESIVSHLMEPDATTVMRTFNMVAAHEDVGKIEESLKRDTALCYRLLCYLNSNGVGLHYRVESIRHAISVIGYDDMLRWLGLLSFAGVREQVNQRALLREAAVRGRLVELLGQHTFSPRERGHAYLIGMLSMLDKIVSSPLRPSIEHLNLANPIKEALLDGSGRYMPYLRLALALENRHVKEAELHAKELGFDFNYICRAQLAANNWAQGSS